MERTFDYKKMSIMKFRGDQVKIKNLLEGFGKDSNEGRMYQSNVGRYKIKSSHLGSQRTG